MGRKSNSRCRAAPQSAACILGCLTQGGALPESHLAGLLSFALFRASFSCYADKTSGNRVARRKPPGQFDSTPFRVENIEARCTRGSLSESATPG